jgi:glycosyltransferase involved in cell wall biosynthesis
MKIFLDGHFLDGKKHGIAKYLLSLYLELLRLRSDITLVIGLEKGSDVSDEFYGNPKIQLIYYGVGGWLRFVVDIPLLVAKIEPDFVHTQNAIPLWRKQGVKFHVTLFDVLYEDFPMYFRFGYRVARSLFFGYAARAANILSTCSDYSSRRIKHHYLNSPRFLGKLVHVIPPGITSRESDSNNTLSPYDSEFVLYVSRFEARKNHLSLVEAFGKVLKTHPGYKLVLVGFEIDGALARTKELVTDISISEAVIFESNVSEARLLSLYQHAALVVYPSCCEGFGMPILESMLVNPRLIFSDTSAMSDFQFASECFMDSSSVQAISTKVAQSLAEPAIIEDRYEIRRDYICKHYRWSHSGALLSRLY